MIFRITFGKQTFGFRFSGRKAVEFDRERDRSPVVQVGSKTYQGLGEIFQTSVEAWLKDDSDATLVGRDCYGEPVLYSYSNIPCFDSGDRQFDSLRGWFLVKDKRELHFITFSRGTMLGSITVFPKLVEAEVGARAPLEAVFGPLDSIRWSEEPISKEIVKTILIPEGTADIADSQFKDYTALEMVVIPDSVQRIGNYAFSGCSNLKSVRMPKALKSIGNGAFHDCIGLEEMTFPEPVTEIGSWALENCESLKRITLPEALERIGEGAFENCVQLQELELPKHVQEIGYGAFRGCTGLKNVCVPVEIPGMENAVFFECSNLADAQGHVIVGGVYYGYYGEQETVKIPDGVTGIAAQAFSGIGSSKLRQVLLPNSLRYIGYEAFGHCSRLKNLFIPDGVKDIAQNAFPIGGNLRELSLPGDSSFRIQEVKVNLRITWRGKQGAEKTQMYEQAVNQELEKRAAEKREVQYAVDELYQHAINEMPELYEFTDFGVSFPVGSDYTGYIGIGPSSLYIDKRILSVSVSDADISVGSDLRKATARELLTFLAGAEVAGQIAERLTALKHRLSE